MRITRVQLDPITTPREVGPPSQHIIVRLHTDDGLVGVGEMPDFSHLPAMVPDVDDLQACLQMLMEGRDPLHRAGIADALRSAFPGSRFGGKTSLIACGVDIAVHDLAAKALDVPVHTLLGGRVRDRIPVSYPLFRTTSAAEVDAQLERVRRKRAEGFSAYRLYVGACPEADAAVLEGVGEEYGQTARIVAIDASGLLSPAEFLGLYRRLESYEFDYVESPVCRPDVEALANVRGRIGHPVSEHVEGPAHAIELVRRRAVDIFNISVSVAGGLLGAKALFNIAEAAGLACLIGTTQETSIATAAQAHLGASVSRLQYPSNPIGPRLYTEDVARRPVEYADGALVVPGGPGLGVELDEEQLERLRSPLSMLEQMRAKFPRE